MMESLANTPRPWLQQKKRKMSKVFFFFFFSSVSVAVTSQGEIQCFHGAPLQDRIWISISNGCPSTAQHRLALVLTLMNRRQKKKHSSLRLRQNGSQFLHSHNALACAVHAEPGPAHSVVSDNLMQVPRPLELQPPLSAEATPGQPTGATAYLITSHLSNVGTVACGDLHLYRGVYVFWGVMCVVLLACVYV